MYDFDQSPLYKITTKKKMAEKLLLSAKDLIYLAENTDVNYRVFSVGNKEKPRTIQTPKSTLKVVHKRLFRQLQRINYPDYLHSGVKGRSYVTNAKVHVGDIQLYKLDIKTFFPSVSPGKIYYFFNEYLQCANDVSGLFKQLCTYGEILPTGSSISQIIACYAYKPMFDELYELAIKNKLSMTCYVDDLTFSGKNISKRFQYEAQQIIKKSGLHYHKEHFYGQSKCKNVTGVIIDGHNLKLANKHQLSIYQALKIYKGLPPGKERDEVQKSLMGRYSSASTIDPSYKKHTSKICFKK